MRIIAELRNQGRTSGLRLVRGMMRVPYYYMPLTIQNYTEVEGVVLDYKAASRSLSLTEATDQFQSLGSAERHAKLRWISLISL